MITTILLNNMENLDLSKKDVIMKCNNIEELSRTIMSVSSFLFQKVRGDETYDKFVLCNENVMHNIKNKIPNGFLERIISEIPNNNIIILFGKENKSVFGVIEIQHN